MPVRREFVEDLYRNTLGRGDNFTPQEVEGWMGADSEDAVRNAFLGSPEYTSAHGGTPTWTNDAQGYMVPTDSAPTSHGYDVQGGGGGNAIPGGVSSAGSFNPTTANWNNLHGFAAANYYNPDMNSMKYMFARIAADYDPSKPGALQAMYNDPRFKTAFPNAKLVGKDSIDFGGQLSDGSKGLPVGVVDVGEAFLDNQSGKAWQWLDQANSGGGMTGTAKAGGGVSDLSSLLGRLGQLGAQYGGPGGAGITNGPLQQVGQDDFSQLMVGALVDFLQRGGTTEFGEAARNRILDAVDNGGTPDDAQMMRRFESARELMEKGRRTAVEAARGDLANRNLLSEPGIPQGAEIGAIRRLNEQLGADFAHELRDISIDENSRADARQMQALQLMTGMAGNEAQAFLAGIGEGTARQQMLGDLALRSLQTNMAWNQFLAEFGLKRDQVLSMMQDGRVDDVMQLLNSFLSLASLSRGGYI